MKVFHRPCFCSCCQILGDIVAVVGISVARVAFVFDNALLLFFASCGSFLVCISDFSLFSVFHSLNVLLWDPFFLS